MRVDATFCENVTGLENLSVRNFDSGTIRDQISLGVSGLRISNDDLTFLLGIFNCDNTTKFSNDRKSLRFFGYIDNLSAKVVYFFILSLKKILLLCYC